MARKILFVDDESDLQFMVATYFELHGYDVVGASDAEEAVRRAEGASLDAIILDVTLPGEGSSKLFDFLKLNHPAAPIILYTGRQSDDDIVQDMLKRGAKCYLLKDGSLASLLATVMEVCV